MDDPNYQAVKALEADGKGFSGAQSALIATGAYDEYSKWDQANDDLLLNDKELRQSSQASRAVLGAIGAAAGFGGAILSTPACITGAGCAIPAFSGLGGAASFVDGWQATGQLFAPYDYTQGSKVLASFDSATYPGDVNPLRDYGTEAAKAAMEIALLKGAGKYLDGSGASVLVSGVKATGPIVPDVISPTYRELQGLNKGFQAHHTLPQYLGKMLGYTKNDMLDHPATLITQYSHTGKVNPDAMHKAISKYLPPMVGGKPATYTSGQISSGLQKAYGDIGRPELFDSIKHLIK